MLDIRKITFSAFILNIYDIFVINFFDKNQLFKGAGGSRLCRIGYLL